MKKLFACAFSIPFAVTLAACNLGDEPGTGDEHPDDPKPPITGTITTNTTWSGNQPFEGITVIKSGVVVTVMPGTTLTFSQAAGITVEGTLDIAGSSAMHVLGKPAAGTTFWGPIAVSGTLSMSYADFDGGAISTNGGSSSLVIADSKMTNAPGDYIIMNGGSINMMYSNVGPDDGKTSSTHCNLHINSSASVSIIHSNINGAPFGLMFYGGFGGNFQQNNWYGNSKDIDTKSGVMGNVSFGWFEKGAPVAGPGATLTAENLSATKLTAAGPRE